MEPGIVGLFGGEGRRQRHEVESRDSVLPLGGGVYATIPPLGVLKALYAFWGLTTILLFWAALIRATREWGGPTGPGRAYGILDGGRGLVSALLARMAVTIFGAWLPAEAASATLAQRAGALTGIIRIFAGLTLGAAVLVWYSVPEAKPDRLSGPKRRLTLEGARTVLRMPAVWLQAAIVICAYAATRVPTISLFLPAMLSDKTMSRPPGSAPFRCGYGPSPRSEPGCLEIASRRRAPLY